MKILLFGATGMVGQGALRECLLDPAVDSVVSVGRTKSGVTHPKLLEIIKAEPTEIDSIEAKLRDVDACLFCLGISSVGLSEAEYHRITYDMTLSVARTLARIRPELTFIYVSGAGSDSTEKGGTMWARVKGKTENAVFALPFAGKYSVRPGYIQPMNGVRSKTALYRAIYLVLSPFYPLLEKLFPAAMTTSEKLGRAMVRVAIAGADKPILENLDINRLADPPALTAKASA